MQSRAEVVPLAPGRGGDLPRASPAGAGHARRLSRQHAPRREPPALRPAPHARHHLSRREVDCSMPRARFSLPRRGLCTRNCPTPLCIRNADARRPSPQGGGSLWQRLATSNDRRCCTISVSALRHPSPCGEGRRRAKRGGGVGQALLWELPKGEGGSRERDGGFSARAMRPHPAARRRSRPPSPLRGEGWSARPVGKRKPRHRWRGFAFGSGALVRPP